MKYSLTDFPAHLTMVGELNGKGAYEAAGRRIRPYPPFVTAPQSVASQGDLVIKPQFCDVVVYPEVFLVIGEDIEIGQGSEKAVMGYGIALGMYQRSLANDAKAKGAAPRDLGCCHWYQLQSDATHIIGTEIKKTDTDELKLRLCIGESETVYDMAQMIWKPDKFLSQMSLLAQFRKNDMVFMGPVDAVQPLNGQKKITIKSNVFDDLIIEVKYL